MGAAAKVSWYCGSWMMVSLRVTSSSHVGIASAVAVVVRMVRVGMRMRMGRTVAVVIDGRS